MAWVARSLSRNGRRVLLDVFRGDECVDQLLVVGFYLLNLGFVCYWLKTSAVGRPSWVAASIEKQGGRGPRRDSGQFRYYAGPRKVHAPGTCVRWGGGITHGTQSAGFATDWEHCR